MLRMFRELKGSYRYIVLIFALLFGQAFCDLALPSYTSDIINVGVQQGGIPDSVPDQIRESSMDQLFLFMDSDQQQEVKEYYTLKDGVYTHKKLKEEERDSLNTIFGKSMLAVSSLQQHRKSHGSQPFSSFLHLFLPFISSYSSFSAITEPVSPFAFWSAV